MKLIAHRGWSAGGEENSLAALARASGDPRLSGVELDIRLAPGDGRLVLSHDLPPPRTNPPTLDAALSCLVGTDLELLLEVKETGIAPAVIDALAAHGMTARAVMFAFAPVARGFSWGGLRPVRLGVIVPYPWQIDAAIGAHDPDMVLLGWDRPWQRLGFRGWWSLFSLERLQRRIRRPAVVGIVRRRADLRWLGGQGVYGAVADMDAINGM